MGRCGIINPIPHFVLFMKGNYRMGQSLNGKELGKGISQRKDGRYQARYINRFGKRKTLYAKTITEITKKLRDEQYENDQCINRVDTKMTLDIWYEIWISTCKKHCRDTTKRTYMIQYNRLRKELGWRKISSLNLVVLQDAFNKLSSDKSRSDCKALLVDMLNRAMESELINKNTALGIKSVIDNDTKKEKRILSEEETILLLECSKKGMLYPVLIVALNTGMRMGEILGLTWDCVDFENKIIRVEKTLCYLPGDGMHANYQFHAPKNKAGKRNIPMTKDAYEVLMIQKDRWNNISTRFEPRTGFEDLVFVSKTNQPINQANMKESINYLVNRINREHPEQFFEHLTPHGLRHTVATNCIQKGMKPKTLQKILGHNSLQMTMDLYCHVREETLREEMAVLAEMV